MYEYRNLDGMYFFAMREGKRIPVCFSDMNEAEMDGVLLKANNEFLKNMCKILAQTIRKLGDRLDIVSLPQYERSEEELG